MDGDKNSGPYEYEARVLAIQRVITEINIGQTLAMTYICL
jgi:hypothetical protein